AALLDPDGGVGGEPVVGVDDVEGAGEVLDAVGGGDEGAAHGVDLVHEGGTEVEVAALVRDAVKHVGADLALALEGEDVDVVAAALQGGAEFSDVDADAADHDGVKRLPGEQPDTHGGPPWGGRLGGVTG